jgi:RecB family exonuclease
MPVADTNEALLHRIRGEYVEMPGLRLTSEQAARLWHLDAVTVATLLTALVEAKFLYRTRAGAYTRRESF